MLPIEAGLGGVVVKLIAWGWLPPLPLGLTVAIRPMLKLCGPLTFDPGKNWNVIDAILVWSPGPCSS